MPESRPGRADWKSAIRQIKNLRYKPLPTSVAPSGAWLDERANPRLTPWATFYRRSAA